jgi:hypothetical protein
MMLGFRKVRKANIPAEHRDIFERYGETVIQMIAAGGFSPRADELQAIYGNPTMVSNAVRWLTEQSDIKHNHEWRIECLEWSILIWVFIGVLVESGLIHVRDDTYRPPSIISPTPVPSATSPSR